MAGTLKAGFGHEDRNSDGGEVLERETSASEEGEDDEEDSFEDEVDVDGCGEKSLGQAAAVRDLLASMARTPNREDLCTGRNMVPFFGLVKYVRRGCGEKCTWTQRPGRGSISPHQCSGFLDPFTTHEVFFRQQVNH